MWETPVSMEIELHKEHIVVTITSIEHKPSPLRGDIDNYAKSIMDGLNNAAYADDRLVRELRVVKK